jgi:P2 family phage contractile tail tube protein
MAQLTVDRLVNANVYIDGISMLGRIEEVEFAMPKAKMADHKGLGMFGTAEFPAGTDKLEAKLKWTAPSLEALSAMSMFASHQFQIRGSKERYSSQGRIAEDPVICFMTAQFKEGGPLNFKQHEQVDFPTTLAVYHAELFIAGAQVLLYDVMSNLYVVNGIDQLANYRANIGG